MDNIFKNIPDNLPEELFNNLTSGNNFQLQRIVSKGHTAPESGWFEQDDNEWVILLQGHATLEFENGNKDLKAGDYLLIPKHKKHRVVKTSVKPECVWLALHFD